MLNIKKGETEKACFFLGSQMLVANPNFSDGNGRLDFYVFWRCSKNSHCIFCFHAVEGAEMPTEARKNDDV